MTPSAATTLNDELDKVEALGIKIVGEDEVKSLTSKVESLELKDFDFKLIAKTFADYGVSLNDLAAVAVEGKMKEEREFLVRIRSSK